VSANGQALGAHWWNMMVGNLQVDIFWPNP
jgi:hypothetical protein